MIPHQRTQALLLFMACSVMVTPVFAHELRDSHNALCKMVSPEESARADQGDPELQYQVGNMFAFCFQHEQSESAAPYFLRAAKQGHIKSALRLGRIYMMGHGVEQNNVEAYFWLSIGKRLFESTKNPPEELGPNLGYVENDLESLEQTLSRNQVRKAMIRVKKWKPRPEHAGNK